MDSKAEEEAITKARDGVVRREIEAMFEEHSGEPLHTEEPVESMESRGMHIVSAPDEMFLGEDIKLP